MKLDFYGQIFEKILKNEILLKSVQWETSCFMRTDGQTDMTKLTVAFREFANALDNVDLQCYQPTELQEARFILKT